MIKGPSVVFAPHLKIPETVHLICINHRTQHRWGSLCGVYKFNWDKYFERMPESSIVIYMGVALTRNVEQVNCDRCLATCLKHDIKFFLTDP